jgi:hypothetical protein
MLMKVVLLTVMLIAESGAKADSAGLNAAADARSEEYEYLTPETGILFEPGSSYYYQETLLALLLAGSDINRGCQMVVEENVWGTERELAVFIEDDRQTGRWSVVRRFAKKSISQAVSAALFDKKRPEGGDYRPYLKIKASDIGENRGPLSEATAESLSQACEMMLGMVRYPAKTRLLLHPTAVHFAHHDVNHGYRAGKTLFNKGRVGKFRQLLEQLGEVATASVATRPAVDKRVKDAAAALVAELSASGIAVPDIKEEMRSAPPLEKP